MATWIQRVAIVGAAGAVGRAAVQLARHAGAHVTAVARAPRHALCHELGAHDATTLEALDADPQARFDVVFDTTGLVTPRKARRWLGADGRFATLYVSVAALLGLLLRPLLGGPHVHLGVATDTAESMERLRQLAEAGAIRPRLGARFPLHKAAEAHATLERERPDADMVLEPGQA